MLNSRTKGEIAQLQIQIRAAELDLISSLPTTEVYYDVLLDSRKEKRIYRAQIKFCNRLHGNNLEIRLDNKRSKRIFYRHTDIDWLLIFIPQKNVILKYEKQHFHRKKRLTINLNDIDSPWHFSKFIW